MSFTSPMPRSKNSATPAPAQDELSQSDSTPMPEAPMPVRRPRHGRRLTQAGGTESLTGSQRLLLLDTWRRSGLPAGDFAPLPGPEPTASGQELNHRDTETPRRKAGKK